MEANNDTTEAVVLYLLLESISMTFWLRLNGDGWNVSSLFMCNHPDPERVLERTTTNASGS